MKNVKPTGNDCFLIFKPGEQTSFLRNCKNSVRSWGEMAELLSVHRSMIFQYLSEKSKLPYASFNKLKRIAAIAPADFTFRKVSYPLLGKTRIPQKITPELAEFVGIILGDGNINYFNHQITISGGIIDGEYITRHVPKLIKKLFSKGVGFRRMTDRAVDCRFCSKTVCEYLLTRFKITSPKADSTIPSKFFQQQALLEACVKGLFDTDGGLHRHHKKSAQLKFTNKSLVLVQSLERALKALGYNPIQTVDKRNNVYSVYLFNHEIKRYFLNIGSSNPKHLLKFESWAKSGIVPLNKELAEAPDTLRNN